ncbi:hypothetical protein Pyrfu_0542 [Pyrolobus fumarii 1A]|uniref:Uncharacterized protein n=1 Tax=Pyrolobus fumarii (strain DSM 11204 / 1A) TaxID=694429 RepID=G0EGN9_PYRF1|nr:hypothetical protein [Pyrolobus fumarii]AEM38413.1 hypothetical protein Pyrfu_0542 [Pyrolobus fumarii 1A]
MRGWVVLPLVLLIVVLFGCVVAGASLVIDVLDSYVGLWDVSGEPPTVMVAGVASVTDYYYGGGVLGWKSGPLDLYDHIVLVIGPFHEYVAYAWVEVRLDYGTGVFFIDEFNDDDLATSGGSHTVYNTLYSLFGDPRVAYTPGEAIDTPEELGFRVYCDRDIVNNAPYCFIITGFAPALYVSTPGVHVLFARVYACMWDWQRQVITRCVYDTMTYTFTVRTTLLDWRTTIDQLVSFLLLNMTSTLGRIEASVSTLGRMASSMRNTLEAVRTSVDLLDAKLDMLESGVEAGLARLERSITLVVYNATGRLEGEVARITMRIEGLSSEVSRAATEIQRRVNELAETLASHDRNLTMIAEEVTRSLEGLEVSMNATREEVRLVARNATLLTLEVEIVKDKLDTLADNIVETLAAIDRLRYEMSMQGTELQGTVNNLKSTVANSTARLETLMRETRKALSSRIEELNHTLITSLERLAEKLTESITRQAATTNRTIAELQERLENVSHELGAMYIQQAATLTGAIAASATAILLARRR